MAQLFTNNASTLLNGAIDNVQTTITVQDGSLFPAPTGSDYFLVTIESPDGSVNEVLKVTDNTANVFTVERGYENTAVSFVDQCLVQLRLTQDTAENFVQAAGLNYPAVDGIDQEILTTDGAGNLYWGSGQALLRESIGTATSEVIDITDGTLQEFTVTADSTISFDMQDGDSIMLHLYDADLHSVTITPVSWIGQNTPVLHSKDVLSFYKLNGTVYAAYLGQID